MSVLARYFWYSSSVQFFVRPSGPTISDHSSSEKTRTDLAGVGTPLEDVGAVRFMLLSWNAASPSVGV